MSEQRTRSKREDDRPRCHLAIGLDCGKRSYFVSVDGAHFRRVPYLPLGRGQARRLFGEAAMDEHNRLELTAKYGSQIAFMPIVE